MRLQESFLERYHGYSIQIDIIDVYFTLAIQNWMPWCLIGQAIQV